MEELNVLDNKSTIAQGHRTSYKIGGMSCMSCVAKVTTALQALPEVVDVAVDKATDSAVLVTNHSVEIDELAAALKQLDPKYSISQDHSLKDSKGLIKEPVIIEDTEVKSWLETYRPILLVFGYIFGITLLIQWNSGAMDLKVWMRHFMAGFFLIFSFFKIMDLKGFADSYMGYDLIARQWRGWAYLYAFIEFGLGIAYVMNFSPLATNIVAFSVMTISIIGVLRSVLRKQEIQCACLGAVFNLPMSTVTIIEDALMIAMSGYMILNLW